MKLTAETTLKGIAIAMGAIAALMATIELQRAIDEDTAPTAVVSDEPLKSVLLQCRTLTKEDLATDTTCQAAWAENRRRFFGASSTEDEQE